MTTILVENHRTTAAQVSRYLPSNYHMTDRVTDQGQFIVEGEDRLGWTAEGYVIPRLQSGWISACIPEFNPTVNLTSKGEHQDVAAYYYNPVQDFFGNKDDWVCKDNFERVLVDKQLTAQQIDELFQQYYPSH